MVNFNQNISPRIAHDVDDDEDQNWDSSKSYSPNFKPVPRLKLGNSGQSYKHITLIIYDFRVVITSKLLTFTTLGS